MALCGHAQICPDGTSTGNLITNGTFSADADGSFTSGFTFVSGSTSPGTWGISTNPNLKDNDFTSLKDHTTGTGNMMIIDVDGTVGKAAYQTTVNGIVPNTTYFFSAWFVNINKNYTNSPQLKFSINGVQLGSTVTVSDTTRKWQQFFISWNSGSFSGNNLLLRIDNMRNTGTGNDLAIDDIVFSSSCNMISNRTNYGATSKLIDTLHICDATLPYNLSTLLNASQHTFSWKTSASNTLATSSNYSLTSIPSYSKLYVCYDSTGDNITCPKLDSVIIVKKINANLGPNLKLCEPFSVTLNSNVSTPGVSIEWQHNSSILPNNGTSLLANKTGTYSISVTKTGCPTATSQMVIATYNNALTGEGYYCSNNSEAVFKVNNANRITNNLNLKWYNTANGGTPLSSQIINDSTIKVNNSVYGNTTSCARALWVEDNNAFTTTLTQPLTTASSTTSTDARTRISIKGSSVTIDSISFYADNNTTSTGTKPYQISIFKSTDLSNPIYVSPIFNYSNVNIPTLRTVPINYKLTGSNTGVNYWIQITGQIAYYTNDPTYPYNNVGTNIISTHEFYRSGSSRPSEIGFIHKITATAGNLNPCVRSLICADIINCTLPLSIIDFSVKNLTDNQLYFNWELSNNDPRNILFLEYSNDGINFNKKNVTKFNGQCIISSNAFGGAKYFRLKVVENTSEVTYSNIIKTYLQTNISVYPNSSSTEFNVTGHTSDCEFSIFSYDGKLIENGFITQEENTFGSTLLKGFYLLILKNEQAMHQFKIEKK